MRKTTKIIAAALGAVGGIALWWRQNPSACSYSQRFWVEAPHPFITRTRLMDALAPRPGDHLLEIGPGTGYYTIEVARALGREGVLEILDLQQEMLDHTMRRAASRSLTNLVPTQGDARKLPYEEETFDGVFLVTVLGEVPDQDAALREIARALKPGGRLIVGELFGDPHMVRLRDLVSRAEAVGLSFTGRTGPVFGYFAAFSCS